jgi:hypothetical protein
MEGLRGRNFVAAMTRRSFLYRFTLACAAVAVGLEGTEFFSPKIVDPITLVAPELSIADLQLADSIDSILTLLSQVTQWVWESRMRQAYLLAATK